MNWMLRDGQSLAQFRVVSPLGAGGMGEVYLAEDTRLGRRVAIKVLTERHGADEDRLRRFEQEARAVSALNHPNILTIHDIGTADGVRFIATEFVDGDTLRTRLARGRLTLESAVDIALQVAGAIAAAHDAGIVHRDLKPENVMLRRDGFVKVLDFGLAKLIERVPVGDSSEGTHLPSRSTPGVVMGTFSYMSPEQARGQVVDHRSDLFSLGVLLYEMLTGVTPFSGPTAADVLASLIGREPAPPSSASSGAVGDRPHRREGTSQERSGSLSVSGRDDGGASCRRPTERRALTVRGARQPGVWATRGSRLEGQTWPKGRGFSGRISAHQRQPGR